MEKCAYIINTTPSYFYILRLHLTLLERYGGKLRWKIFLATEVPTHSLVLELCKEFPWLGILSLSESNKGFLDSRLAAVRALPVTIEYIFPIQEDFLLEARPLHFVLEEAFHLFEKYRDVKSLRLMPCPGPKTNKTFEGTQWKVLDISENDMLFSYQATLWRKDTYITFLQKLIDPMISAGLSEEKRKRVEIHDNIAEVDVGQKLLASLGGLHLAWPREGTQPNAVYLSPWPYRPTAIVRGKIESWAEELAEREKVLLRSGPSLR